MEKYRIAAVVILAFLVMIYAVHRKFRRANPWSRTPYERQDYFLSAAEKCFYDVLMELVGEDITICPKPAVREVLRVRADVKKDRQKYFNWISQKHVDFVLCDRDSMEILCAVELDDSTHNRRDRHQRDAFMDKAFQKAGLPLFHVPCRKVYGARELRELCEFLYGKDKRPVKDFLYEQQDTDEAEEEWEEMPPLCPKCGVPMVLRTAARGEYRGQQFYGCPNFPRCREIKPL